MASGALAKPEFAATIPHLAQIPQPPADPNNPFSTDNIPCQTCHLQDPDSHVVIVDLQHMTPFGVRFHDINNAITTDMSQWRWRPEVAVDDSDGDGFPNGWELQDPNGTWVISDPLPGDPNLVTHPGYATSRPPLIVLSTAALDPNTPQGFDAASDTFGVSNGGGLALTPTISDDVGFLAVDASSVGTRTVTYSTSSLAVAGSPYTGHITVAQAGVMNSPQTITVTLTVEPRCGNGTTEGTELCDGGDCCTASCTFKGAGVTCRAANDVCDVPETCSGSSGACPADVVVDNGTACDLPNDVCQVNGHCSAGHCVGAASSCGDGILQPNCGGEQCDDGNKIDGDCCSSECQFESAATVCRPAVSDCDLADHCTGSSGTCPADQKQPNGTTCSDGNVCTIKDQCQSGVCVGDPHTCGDHVTQSSCGESCDGEACCTSECQIASTAVVCRPANSTGCDVPDFCTGDSAQCTAPDASKPAGTFCGEEQSCSANGVCAAPPPTPQDKNQSACITAWEKSVSQAVRARSEQVEACIVNGSKGKLSKSIDVCAESPTSKVTTSISKADQAARKQCTSTDPNFGIARDADLAGVTDEETLAAFEGIFGQALDQTVPASTVSLTECQQLVAKTTSTCMETRFDDFAKCARQGVGAKIDAFNDFVDLQNCLDQTPHIDLFCSPLRNTKLNANLSKKCIDSTLLLGPAFPGCQAADPNTPLNRNGLFGCLDRVSRCHACKAIKVWANLPKDCDSYDDGNGENGSCPETTVPEQLTAQ